MGLCGQETERTRKMLCRALAKEVSFDYHVFEMLHWKAGMGRLEGILGEKSIHRLSPYLPAAPLPQRTPTPATHPFTRGERGGTGAGRAVAGWVGGAGRKEGGWSQGNHFPEYLTSRFGEYMKKQRQIVRPEGYNGRPDPLARGPGPASPRGVFQNMVGI